jgi:hypothetical protein
MNMSAVPPVCLKATGVPESRHHPGVSEAAKPPHHRRICNLRQQGAMQLSRVVSSWKNLFFFVFRLR